jgi:hypothetical protein
VELVGRTAEISRLQDLITGAGQGGAALILRGEPGIGKTALFTEAAVFARTSGCSPGLTPLPTARPRRLCTTACGWPGPCWRPTTRPRSCS